ncbi:MAG TPA: response regulator [Bryobacteraceae bacterium]|nr:response regulator [Bryobacteraceae bacterium]
MQRDSIGARDGSGPIIVAIDDDYRVRESIESLLKSAGYKPELFESADEFLRSGMLADAGCVITDVRMPGMDGIELQRRIRQQDPALPVIVISAHMSDEARQSALDGGAIEFLYKPFDGAELLGAVQTALSKSR